MVSDSRAGAAPATLEALRAAGRAIGAPQPRRIEQQAMQQAEQLAVWEDEGGASGTSGRNDQRINADRPDRTSASMTALRRLAFIGNSLPRHCGIATFTTDLQQAIASRRARSRPASSR